LGKIPLPDALIYVVAQFSGAIGGVCIARYVLPVGRSAIKHAVTTPGIRGSAIAFIAELTISFILMSTILVSSNRASSLHSLSGRFLVRDFHNPRSTAFRNEYESRQKLWTSFPCELLARNLALFHCADSRHAHRRGSVSAISRWSPSLLRQTAPCQR